MPSKAGDGEITRGLPFPAVGWFPPRRIRAGWTQRPVPARPP